MSNFRNICPWQTFKLFGIAISRVNNSKIKKNFIFFSKIIWLSWNIVPAMKGEKEIEMSDMKTEDEKETDIDAEIEKANIKMVSFGELVSNMSIIWSIWYSS